MLSAPKGPGQKYEKVRVEQGEGEREKEYIREQNLLDINSDIKDQDISKKMAESMRLKRDSMDHLALDAFHI